MVMNKDISIIIPTYSDYIDIVEILLKLFKKNWQDCQFKVIVSMTGKNIEIKSPIDVDVLYNGSDATLVDCVVNAAKRNPNKYYIILLGDAFIASKIDNEAIMNLLNELLDGNIEYCSLLEVEGYTKEKIYNCNFRFINSADRYSHNFVAFMASSDYIFYTLSSFKTDFDFEMFYLNDAKNGYYNNHLIVRKNYFCLLPSITKGKWDRINYEKLRRQNPGLIYTERKIMNWRESILRHLRTRVITHISPSRRANIKKRVEKIFDLDFGVKE